MPITLEKFKAALAKRTKTGQIQNYFKKAESLDSGEIKIVYNEQKINAYRNTGCLKLECVYDFEELVTKFTEGGNNENLVFTCAICNTQINMKNFFRDTTLMDTINDTFHK